MDAAIARHPGDRGLMPWAIRVPLQPDESPSSWLVRAALLHGCDPLALTGSVWSKWRAWTVDVDRGLDADRLRRLSIAASIPPTRFTRAVLRSDAEVIAGRTLRDAETWPWVLALGSRNRRRHGGHQLCPVCLSEDVHPYFRRHWRFAWHVACARHCVLLVDGCGDCGAPIAFHRLLAKDRHLALCSRCRRDLRRTVCVPASAESLTFQSMADDALASGFGAMWDRRVTVAEWFVAARFFVGAIRRTTRRQASRLAGAIRSLGVNLPEQAVPMTGLPLEMSSALDRHVLLGAAFRLMQAGPLAWAAALRENDVAAAALHDDAQCLPEPVRAIAASLPSGRGVAKRQTRRARTAPRSEAAVWGAWTRLQRRAKVGEP